MRLNKETTTMLDVSTSIIAYTEMKTLDNTDEAWETVYDLAIIDTSPVINIDYAIEYLESREDDPNETLTKGEKEILKLLKLAESKGAAELSVY